MSKIICIIFLIFSNFIFAQKYFIKKSELNSLQLENVPKKAIANIKNLLTPIKFSVIQINVCCNRKIITILKNDYVEMFINNYIIQDDNIVELNTIPKDENFYKSLENTIIESEKMSFNKKIEQSEVIKMIDSDTYLISGIIYLGKSDQVDKNTFSYEEIPCILEYETKNFKDFSPLRFRNADNNWINAKK